MFIWHGDNYGRGGKEVSLSVAIFPKRFACSSVLFLKFSGHTPQDPQRHGCQYSSSKMSCDELVRKICRNTLNFDNSRQRESDNGTLPPPIPFGYRITRGDQSSQERFSIVIHCKSVLRALSVKCSCFCPFTSSVLCFSMRLLCFLSLLQIVVLMCLGRKTRREATNTQSAMDRRQLVVDTKGGADFTSIADAIRAAAPGDIILLRMGLFEEKVHLTKEVELTIDNGVERGEAVINSGLIVTANVVVRNVFIQQQVDVRKGTASFIGCDISLGTDGIRIATDAKALIQECTIHDVSVGGDGVYLQEGAVADVERCEIYGCRVNGVHCKGGELHLRYSKIYNCDFGVYFRKNGKGSVEGNTIEKIKSFGVYVTSGSDPNVQKNFLKGCELHGVMVAQQGSGHYKDNDVDGSVRILRGCTHTLNVNTITGRVDNETVAQQPAAVAA